eukprot:8131635-Lingulodinium_polyedra.AAC.1
MDNPTKHGSVLDNWASELDVTHATKLLRDETSFASMSMDQFMQGAHFRCPHITYRSGKSTHA